MHFAVAGCVGLLSLVSRGQRPRGTMDMVVDTVVERALRPGAWMSSKAAPGSSLGTPGRMGDGGP